MSDDFLEKLSSHHWKGNIRELKNVMERAVIMVDNQTELTTDNLPFDIQFSTNNTTQSTSLFDLASVEKQHIQKILLLTKGNKTESSRLLGIGLTTLYRKIEEYNIS
jgi:two-component system, NtrC family, response regulator